MATNDDLGSILHKYVPDMKELLEADEMIDYLIAEEVVTTNDRPKLTNSAQNTKREVAVNLYQLIKDRRRYSEFLTALRRSSDEHPGHKHFLDMIESELEERTQMTQSDSVTKPTSGPGDQSHQSDDAIDSEVDSPADQVRHKSTHQATGQTGDTTESTPPEVVGSETIGANKDDDRWLACITRILLLLMLPVSAAGGITLIVISIRGFINEEECTIGAKSSLDAFIFIFGLLCLVIPTVFALLVVIHMCYEFEVRYGWFTPGRILNGLVTFTVIFVVVAFIIAITELIYSIYVATQTYGMFQVWRNETDLCSRAVFISSFTTLTVFYILAFIGFVSLFFYLIQEWVQAKLNDIGVKHIRDLVQNYILCCFANPQSAQNGQPNPDP